MSRLLTRLTMLNIQFDNIKADLNVMFAKKRFYIALFTAVLLFISYRYVPTSVFNTDPAKRERYLADVINHRLEEIRVRHNCDYTAINIFKVSKVTGTEQMDRLYEATGPGKIPLGPVVRDYECEVFKRSFNHLKQRGHVYIPNTEVYTKDTYLAKTLISLGYKSVFYVGIYDLDARLYKMEDGCMGFVTYEFSNTTNFTEAELTDMIIEVDLLTPYILKKHGTNI